MREFVCGCSQSQKNFNGYMVLKAVVKFCKNVSIGNIFLAKFAGILANIFQHKEIQVYSSVLQQQGGSKKCS